MGIPCGLALTRYLQASGPEQNALPVCCRCHGEQGEHALGVSRSLVCAGRRACCPAVLCRAVWLHRGCNVFCAPVQSLNIFNSRLVLATPDTATDGDFARIEGGLGSLQAACSAGSARHQPACFMAEHLQRLLLPQNEFSGAKMNFQGHVGQPFCACLQASWATSTSTTTPATASPAATGSS